MMHVSLVATVLNEEDSIPPLLDSIINQSTQPNEVIIVDGGSTDRTLEILRSYCERLPLRIFTDPGCSISHGRNLAIEFAKGDVIASTDAGVRLSPHWLSELLKPFIEVENGEKAQAVAGFFMSDPQTIFEAAMGATVLPNIDELVPSTFLPSSRSVAFTKEIWQRVGGYPNWLDYCEDLVFDFKLKAIGCAFAWAPKAIAHFRPRPNLPSFSRQYYRYARGDGKANLWLKRHLIRYGSYLSGLTLIAAGFWLPLLWVILLGGLGIYLYRPYLRLMPHLNRMRLGDKLCALFYVPIIRVTGDMAKMAGYPVGTWWRLRYGRNDKTERFEKKNG